MRWSTNRRIADDKLACWRPSSICATNFDSVDCCLRAISFRSLQKASSRLTLVLCPSMMTDRLMIEDFIVRPVAPLPTCLHILIRSRVVLGALVRPTLIYGTKFAQTGYSGAAGTRPH